MPWSSIRLIPGINVEQTPSLNEAGYSTSKLIRFRQGLAEKRGGWSKYISAVLGGVPRAILGWVDTLGTARVGVGTTTELDVVVSGGKTTITPQTVTTNNAPNFTTTMSSATVTIVDSSVTTGSLYDTAYIQTQVTIGGIVLFGAYPIASIVSSTSYTITAASAATSAVANAGAVATFSTSSGSVTVTVVLASHGFSVGSTYNVIVPITIGGITLSGNYTVIGVASSSQFTINAAAQATSTAGPTSQNSGNARIVYYYAIPNGFTAAGYGLGNYGAGAYGFGTSNSRSGTAITATDWTLANWGRIIMACAPGGPIFQWDPILNYTTAFPIPTAPFSCKGMTISAPQQIMIAWGADFVPNADPLLLRWSDAGNYNTWVASSTNQAGSYRIPSGGQIIAVVASPVATLVFTDIEVWVMTYIGLPFVFGFTKIGSNCGLTGVAAVAVLNTQIFWMGPNNFYVFTGGSVQAIPCPVWDAVFQNLNLAQLTKIRAGTTAEFNEVIWHYPGTGSAENNCYVQYNNLEKTWDIGPAGSMPRSAWTDPAFTIAATLSASPTGVLYQQESGQDADGTAMSYSFTTGYSAVGDGELKPFVDWFIPDFIYQNYNSSSTPASVQVTFNGLDYPWDTPTTYGPFTVTNTTEGVPVRIRNRLVSITVAGSDLGSFVRLGRVRYRWAPDGRR